VQFACLPASYDIIYVPVYEMVQEYNDKDELTYLKTMQLSQAELRQRVIFRRGKRPRIKYIASGGINKLDKHNPTPRFSSQE
jgi:hypothetical protein